MYEMYIAPMAAIQYDSIAAARAHLKEVVDAAEAGRPTALRRGNRRTSVVDADRLRDALATLRPARAEVVAENGGWTVLIPGLPVAADGSTLEEALTEMIDALREYADDWADQLQHAPNHREHWALVQLIALSDDEHLRQWLVGE